MNETLLQKMLRYGGIDALEAAPYFINVKQSERFPELFLFKYDQIRSPLESQVVQQCRGHILESGDWRYVSRPFDKFFNAGDTRAAPIDWSTARVLEKLDGSLMQLYQWKDEWHVASSGNPDAAGKVDGDEFTFQRLFWDTWRQWGLRLPSIDCDMTFLFELTSPYNRIVVKQNMTKLTLIGARETSTGVECSPKHIGSLHGWPVVREYKQTVEGEPSVLVSLNKRFNETDPLDSEGFVVVDSCFQRVKVKHPGYVKLHSLRGNGTLTQKRALIALLQGDDAELLSIWPEWKPIFDDVRGELLNLAAGIDTLFAAWNQETSPQAFAKLASTVKFSSALFALRNKRAQNGWDWVVHRAPRRIDGKVVNVDALDSLIGAPLEPVSGAE